MKLYTKIKSDRASKNQGGNRFIHVDILVETDKGNELVGRLEVINAYDNAIIRFQNIKDNIGLGIAKELKRIKLKGKKL